MMQMQSEMLEIRFKKHYVADKISLEAILVNLLSLFVFFAARL